MKTPRAKIISRWIPPERRSYPARPLGALPLIWAIGVGLLIGYGLRSCESAKPEMRASVEPRVWLTERVEP